MKNHQLMQEGKTHKNYKNKNIEICLKNWNVADGKTAELDGFQEFWLKMLNTLHDRVAWQLIKEQFPGSNHT